MLVKIHVLNYFCQLLLSNGGQSIRVPDQAFNNRVYCDLLAYVQFCWLDEVTFSDTDVIDHFPDTMSPSKRLFQL